MPYVMDSYYFDFKMCIRDSYNTRAGFAAMRPLWFNMLQQVFNGTDPQAAADEFNASANSN